MYRPSLKSKCNAITAQRQSFCSDRYNQRWSKSPHFRGPSVSLQTLPKPTLLRLAALLFVNAPVSSSVWNQVKTHTPMRTEIPKHLQDLRMYSLASIHDAGSSSTHFSELPQVEEVDRSTLRCCLSRIKNITRNRPNSPANAGSNDKYFTVMNGS